MFRGFLNYASHVTEILLQGVFMQAQQQYSRVPLALRQHIPSHVDISEEFGDLNQDWTWTPTGPLKPEQIPGYLASSPQTRRNTNGVSDRSEYD